VTAGAGQLILVATPIGNLGDLAPRAVAALAAAGLVCAEDTRRTGRLLQHAGVRATRMAVVNEHTEDARADEVIAVLGSGADVALVTDAGTPGISDPGSRLVGAVLAAGFEVTTVPGPAAAIAALTISGLPTSRFVFEGFLPRKGRERHERLATLAAEPRTMVLYEAPHRMARTLADLVGVLGPEREVAVARELTKLHETVLRGPIGTIELGEPRGEYVIVIAGVPERTVEPDDDELRAAVTAAKADGASTRDAAASVARRFGVARRRVYDVATATSSVALNAGVASAPPGTVTVSPPNDL
jgi:16S rRNA (cytidine1402-2'-O)-methyltransferase